MRIPDLGPADQGHVVPVLQIHDLEDGAGSARPARWARAPRMHGPPTPHGDPREEYQGDDDDGLPDHNGGFLAFAALLASGEGAGGYASLRQIRGAWAAA